MAHHRLSPSEERLLEEFRRRLLAAAPGQVAALRVFGSGARGASHEGSDLDVAIEPGPGVEPALKAGKGCSTGCSFGCC